MPQIEVSNEIYKQLEDMRDIFNKAENPNPPFSLENIIGICMDYAYECSSTLNGDVW